MDLYQQYIHISRYSRWRSDLGRRETWNETVQRYIDFIDDHTEKEYSSFIQGDVRSAILNMEVMPSMRALMTAGPALARENLAGYNCSYLVMDNPRAFSEAVYLLMCGTGVGFSCERQYISKLPQVPGELVQNASIIVEDSKRGWASAYNDLLHNLWNGVVPFIDIHKVRPAGALLKTFGGRASGPEPFIALCKFTIDTFNGARGRKLNSLEVHDIMCKIGEIVVVGGVRRSALISLSNLSDQRMRNAKSGQWWVDNPQRALANNSVAYTETPSVEIFMEEWLSLMKSKSGERGIFNRVAAQKQASRWGRRFPDIDYGCNPCSEIIMRNKGLCNLSETIVRSYDTFRTLARKVEICTFLGTVQASLTKFNFVSKGWRDNCVEEALLGVSLTGIMDNRDMSGMYGYPVNELNKLRDIARATNRQWARALGIRESAAITCVKPSGTVSQLCNTSSGIHPRHNRNYIRTVRTDKKDPLYAFMRDKGFYMEDDVTSPYTSVVSFPITAPDNSIVRDDISAIEALKIWMVYQKEWCEHKPSVTISVKDHEWFEVGAWVYKNFDDVCGVSFLPHSNHTYKQAPYQDMAEDQLEEWKRAHPLPTVDWKDLKGYEKEDNTVSSQTLACTGNACELG